MTVVKVNGGYLNVSSTGPGHPGQGLPGGEYPDQGLPPGESPVDPGYGIPLPPPGTFPPPVASHPIVPAPPGTPPGVIWPSPGCPTHPIAGTPGHPDQGLPAEPGTPTHPIAGTTYWMLVYTPGHGWKYVTVDPTLTPTPIA
jgi:hypothetical protein